MIEMIIADEFSVQMLEMCYELNIEKIFRMRDIGGIVSMKRIAAVRDDCACAIEKRLG